MGVISRFGLDAEKENRKKSSFFYFAFQNKMAKNNNSLLTVIFLNQKSKTVFPILIFLFHILLGRSVWEGLECRPNKLNIAEVCIHDRVQEIPSEFYHTGRLSSVNKMFTLWPKERTSFGFTMQLRRCRCHFACELGRNMMRTGSNALVWFQFL